MVLFPKVKGGILRNHIKQIIMPAIITINVETT